MGMAKNRTRDRGNFVTVHTPRWHHRYSCSRKSKYKLTSALRWRWRWQRRWWQTKDVLDTAVWRRLLHRVEQCWLTVESVEGGSYSPQARSPNHRPTSPPTSGKTRPHYCASIKWFLPGTVCRGNGNVVMRSTRYYCIHSRTVVLLDRIMLSLRTN